MYVNTSIFAFSLIPITIKYVVQNGIGSTKKQIIETWRQYRHGVSPLKAAEDSEDAIAGERLLVDDEGVWRLQIH